jgi:hypothetical protein
VWVDWLASVVNLGRQQPGGAFWIHRDLRDYLRTRLEQAFPEETRAFAAECHQGIADWYVKLFRASNDPAAALESIYHRLECARAAKLSGDVAGEKMQETALIETLQTIGLARERIVARGHYMHFRAVARRVAEVSGELGDPRIRERLASIELEYARDVGHYEDALPGKRQASRTHAGAGTDDRLVRIASYVGLRAYAEASNEIRQLFEELMMSFVPTLSSSDEVTEIETTPVHPQLFVRFREKAHEWSRQAAKEDLLHYAIRGLRRNMFFLMLNAQLCSTRKRLRLRHPSGETRSLWGHRRPPACRGLSVPGRGIRRGPRSRGLCASRGSPNGPEPSRVAVAERSRAGLVACTGVRTTAAPGTGRVEGGNDGEPGGTERRVELS